MSGRKGGVKVPSCSNMKGTSKMSEQGHGVEKDERYYDEFEQNKEESEWITMGPSEFRRRWDRLWSGHFGSFEDTTEIPPMRFTEKAPQFGAIPKDTLQLFSVKLWGTRRDLKLPVDVFGMVAIRDYIDRNRNIIFNRARDQCQTLTQEDPYLVLTGPTRAVMMRVSDSAVIEVELTVKGATKSEDKYLSFLVAPVTFGNKSQSCLLNYSFTSKLSTLEFKIGHIVSSVEATIFVTVVDGSWPSGVRGIFAVFATGSSRLPTSVDREKIVLLDSGGSKLCVTDDGEIQLSRHVVSVQITGKLVVSVEAVAPGKEVVRKQMDFKASRDGKSEDMLDMGFCKIRATVAWSLISYYHAPPRKSAATCDDNGGVGNV